MPLDSLVHGLDIDRYIFVFLVLGYLVAISTVHMREES
jgi:hypothetical protein